MQDRSVTHAAFTLERFYKAPPARVFAAWATIEGKSAWFVGPPGWTQIERSLDFRIGGGEIAAGRAGNGTITRFDSRFFDIVPDGRIVFAYSMHLNDVRISVSLATIAFAAAENGTRLTVTEQGTFLDGYDDAGSRERGTADLLQKLGVAIEPTTGT